MTGLGHGRRLVCCGSRVVGTAIAAPDGDVKTKSENCAECPLVLPFSRECWTWNQQTHPTRIKGEGVPSCRGDVGGGQTGCSQCGLFVRRQLVAGAARPTPNAHQPRDGARSISQIPGESRAPAKRLLPNSPVLQGQPRQADRAGVDVEWRRSQGLQRMDRDASRARRAAEAGQICRASFMSPGPTPRRLGPTA